MRSTPLETLAAPILALWGTPGIFSRSRHAGEPPAVPLGRTSPKGLCPDHEWSDDVGQGTIADLTVWGDE